MNLAALYQVLLPCPCQQGAILEESNFVCFEGIIIPGWVG